MQRTIAAATAIGPAQTWSSRSSAPDDPDRDYVTKRADYAEAGIPEYWIVDPQDAAITVLALAGNAYAEHGQFRPGSAATSALLPDFSADAAEVLQGS